MSDSPDVIVVGIPDLDVDSDVDQLIEGYELATEAAAARPLVRLAGKEPEPVPHGRRAQRALIRRNAYSVPHVVGTCAMGTSPDDGAVVDARGQVHGIDGLYVVDASIIPEPPAGFPHLVTIMLAERLSASIC